MMEKSGFFNARKLPAGTFDRTYLAEDFAAYFSKFIGNGVYPNPSTGLQVLENDTPDMTVNMQTGYAFINGYTYYNEGIKAFNVEVADGLLNRKDAIFVRWDKVNRQITSVYVKGELSSDPVAPTPIRTADIWDLNPCIINVKAGATKITQADIEDTRMNKSLCGIVTALIEQIDTTTLYLQVQKDLENFQDVTYQEFETWFNEIKGKLGDAPATALQQQITNIMDGTDVPNSGVSVYVHSKSGTVHEFTGTGPNGRALMTANVEAGDTFTVNGSPVTAYVGAEDAVSSMAGSAWNGKWVTFVFENSAINFKGGGGRVTVSGLSAGAVKTGVTVTVKQGAKTVQTVTGTFTNDGNIYNSAVLENLVGYSKGQRIVGTMPNKSSTIIRIPLNGPDANVGGYMVWGNGIAVVPAVGYYGGYSHLIRRLEISGPELASAVGLTPAVLKAGTTVLGVAGALTYVDLLPNDFYIFNGSTLDPASGGFVALSGNPTGQPSIGGGQISLPAPASSPVGQGKSALYGTSRGIDVTNFDELRIIGSLDAWEGSANVGFVGANMSFIQQNTYGRITSLIPFSHTYSLAGVSGVIHPAVQLNRYQDFNCTGAITQIRLIKNT